MYVIMFPETSFDPGYMYINLSQFMDHHIVLNKWKKIRNKWSVLKGGLSLDKQGKHYKHVCSLGK